LGCDLAAIDFIILKSRLLKVAIPFVFFYLELRGVGLLVLFYDS